MSNLNNFIEIAPDIYIGNKIDYINNKNIPNVTYICATNTKDINPYIGNMLKGNILYLDLVDANDIKYINETAINKFIELFKNKQPKDIFVIFCDEGYSRSPTLAAIALLIKNDKRMLANTFQKLIYQFSLIYPEYKPNSGMLEYLKTFWEKTNG